MRKVIESEMPGCIHLTALKKQKSDILQAIKSNEKAIYELEKSNSILHGLLLKIEGSQS